ncbi:FAD-dependent monooxygenase yanF [Colletotrichum gloeosporioides]|uniref:FAD-dependent monooxygenase yanF n=1 Tax=Colletotrichum gloeosporioides TaxID=474922 RepID=A0A8H4C6F3_COLGL|nr:FAD-dependent monooxygenase yanF [Colletotrichum gloeosporioides]KAF3798283.1 FAD-dependent monooxygenase yanF [Colletotrichum gloeosporioides]
MARTGLPPCDALAEAGLGDCLLFATDPGYESRLQTYWSASTRLTPWCIVQPRTSDEVSLTLTTLTSVGDGAGSWHAAVRGGGHNHWPGSNNIANGVTIDLGLLNKTTYNASNNFASDLTEHGISLVRRSRAGGVGASGFLLGGGHSYYTGHLGFGCDNVVNYEVVLSDGRMINANETAHADLYKALKGGASNFGIVTRFDLEAFPSADLYGGSRIISTNYIDQIINAVIAFANYNASQARDTITPTFVHDTQVSPNITIEASILNINGSPNTLMEITRIPAVSEDLRMRSLVSLAQESTVSGTSRSIWLTLTFRAIPVVLHQTVAKWEEFVENMQGFMSTDDFQVQMNFQHLPTYYGTSRRGGNVLGLDSSLVESSVLWVNIVNVQTAEQEAIARLLTNTLRAELEDFAVAENANVPFRYLNYAEPSQDPLRGYGAQNVEFLRKVSKAYDPKDVFQSRIIGGFKISRTT